MTVALNHTIVPAADAQKSADFLTTILGIDPAVRWGPFIVVHVANGVSLDFIDAGDYRFDPRHFAFLVSDEEFDPIFTRIEASGTKYYADPHRQQPGEINHHYGGSGVYFDDPDNHLMEVITRPYGSEPV